MRMSGVRHDRSCGRAVPAERDRAIPHPGRVAQASGCRGKVRRSAAAASGRRTERRRHIAHGDRRRPLGHAAGFVRHAGCHDDFIGFHRAFCSHLSSPVRIFKPVKNLLDRGFPFRTLNGIDVRRAGKTGRGTRPRCHAGNPASTMAAGRSGGWGKRAVAAAVPRRRHHFAFSSFQRW